MDQLLSIINSLIFLVYGVLCIFTQHMVLEFKRYGLLKYRLLTGYLEAFGGIGVLIGFYYSPSLYLFSVSGLALLMTLGLLVRIKVRDHISHALPALGLLILNCYLAYATMMKIN